MSKLKACFLLLAAAGLAGAFLVAALRVSRGYQ